MSFVLFWSVLTTNLAGICSIMSLCRVNPILGFLSERCGGNAIHNSTYSVDHIPLSSQRVLAIIYYIEW